MTNKLLTVLSFFFRVNFCLFIFLTAEALSATNYYWVNGTGEWNDLNHWSLTSGIPPNATVLPGPNDIVVFDENSFIGPNDTVYVGGPAEIEIGGMLWSSVTGQPVFYGRPSQEIINIILHGSLVLHPNMEWVLGEAYPLRLEARGGTHDIQTFGKTGDTGITVWGRGNWHQRGHLSAQFLSVYQGRYFANGHSIAVDQLLLFAFESFTTGLYLENSLVEIESYLSRGLLGDFGTNDSTHFSGFNQFGTIDIEQQFSADTIRIGSITAEGYVQGISLPEKCRTTKISLKNSARIGSLGHVDTLALATGGYYSFGRGSNINPSEGRIGTRVDQLIVDEDCSTYTYIEGRHPSDEEPYALFSSPYHQRLGRVIANGMDVFTSNDQLTMGAWTAEQSVDLGFNGDLILGDQSGRTVYWVGNGGDWYDRNHWSGSSGGPGGACVPGPLDNVVFDANSFNRAGEEVSGPMDLPYLNLPLFCHTMDWEEIDEVVIFRGLDLRVFGSWRLSPFLKYEITATRFSGLGEHELQGNGARPGHLEFVGGGSYVLKGPLFSKDSSLLWMLKGSLRTNGFNLSTGAIVLNSGWSVNDTLDFSYSNITLTGWLGTDNYPDVLGIGTESTNVDEVEGRDVLAMWGGHDNVARGRLIGHGATITCIPGNGRLRFPNQDVGCSVIFPNANGRGEILGIEYQNRFPTLLNKIEFRGDGYIGQDVDVDTLLYSAGKNYQSRGREIWRVKVNTLFNAIGSECRPIELQPGENERWDAYYLFTDSTTFELDYLRLDRTNATGAPPHYAGGGSENVNDSSSGWTFEYSPDQPVFSVRPGFLGPDTLVCDPIDLFPLGADLPAGLATGYRWQNGSTEQEFTPESAGKFILIITHDGGECTSSDTVEVAVSNPENADWFPLLDPSDPNCFAGVGQLVLLGTAPDQVFRIDDGPETLDTLFTDLLAGTYTLTAYGGPGYCPESTEFTLTDPQRIETNLPPTVLIRESPRASIEVEALGGRPPYSFAWSPGDSTINCTDCPAPVFSPVVTTTYRLSVTDAEGCSVTDSMLVIVDRPRHVYLPNAFSPDFDGINDEWEVEGEPGAFLVERVIIADRWGNILFRSGRGETNSGNTSWDGTSRGQPLPTGVYLATVAIRWPDGVVTHHQKSVNLLR